VADLGEAGIGEDLATSDVRSAARRAETLAADPAWVVHRTGRSSRGDRRVITRTAIHNYWRFSQFEWTMAKPDADDPVQEDRMVVACWLV
jgi:hypothetical protein